MAIFLGIFLPLAETVRRIPEILAFQNFFRWFDDYLLGAILLLAAFAVYKQKQNSTMYLIAAWGAAGGALAGSLCGQFDAYFKNLADAGVFFIRFCADCKSCISCIHSYWVTAKH